MVNTTPAGIDIFDWEKSDALKVFSTILKELNKKINKVASDIASIKSKKFRRRI